MTRSGQQAERPTIMNPGHSARFSHTLSPTALMSLSHTLLFLLAATLPSFVIALAAGYLMRWLAPKLGLVDHPGESRKVHTTSTPLGGGVAVWLGVVGVFAIGSALVLLFPPADSGNASAGIWSLLPEFVAQHVPGVRYRLGGLWTLLGAATVLMLLGLADDRYSLSWKIRLAVQVLVAAACALRADWRLTGFIDSQFVTLPLTVLWIVALINSFNMLDNMDGLSGGVAAIASGMLAVVLLIMPDPTTQVPQLFVAGFLLCLVGGVMGFLWHNKPPAKIFMGDCGSYFLGFCIAIATLQATFTSYDSTRPHTLLAPLCVLAVPLYDMISVLTIRIREGRSPFEADRRHFSHRLVDLGMTKPQAVATIYLTTLTCSLGAVLLHEVNLIGAAVVMAMVACVLAIIAVLETTAARRERK